jgi:MYXO-CTERM domain-containing protein
MRRSACVPSGILHLLVAAAALLTSRSAFALVTEPNGLVVPLDSANGEVQIYQFFQAAGEAINWQQDAHTTPDAFSPLCNFSATFVLHQAGATLGLGWYNVDPNATQPPTQINVLIPPGTPVGTTISSAQILGDPNYTGGSIGFALVGWQTHYSEQKWNPVCSSCGSPGPWATALIYKAVKFLDAYYVAFEDGPVDGSGFHNDGDFNDDVFLVSGLVCAGGGRPCETGAPGVCGTGLSECDQSGMTCKQVNQPGTESCDGLDNDCNGVVDDGDLCPQGQVCDHGKCVGQCGKGEFACPGGRVCSGGYCVDAACASVTCAEGEVCVGGTCQGPCDGVVCPAPYVCQLGVCVDACAGVSCTADKVCQSGVCVTKCGCMACDNGLACDSATGVCVEPSCVGVTCGAGESCQGGACVPACTGAVCPAGQTCQAGQCIDAPADSDAGNAGGGVNLEGGIGSGGTTQQGKAGRLKGGTTDASAEGCACRSAPPLGSSSAPLALLAALGLVLRRRRLE